jgi:hypothetical protein
VSGDLKVLLSATEDYEKFVETWARGRSDMPEELAWALEAALYTTTRTINILKSCREGAIPPQDTGAAQPPA